MRIKLKIQQKIQFFILGIVSVIFLTAIGYIGFQVRDKAIENSLLYTESMANQYAAKLEKKLEADIVITRTLAKTVETYLDYSEKQRKQLIEKIYPNVLSAIPQIDAIWDEWDQNTFDSVKADVIRDGYMCWWENGIIRDTYSYFNYYSESYYERKGTLGEGIQEPYLYQYPGEPDSVLITDLNNSVINEMGEYAGCVAIDFRLTYFQDLISNIKLFKNSFAMLYGNSGSCIGHPDTEKLGISIKDIYPEQTIDENLLDKIKTGNPHNFTSDVNDEEFYFVFKPVNIGKTKIPWSLGIVIPMEEVNYLANETIIISIIVGLFGLCCLSIIIWMISKNITRPLQKITNSMRGLSRGEIGNLMKFETNRQDEIALMGEAFNVSIDALNDKTRFAEEIGKGNLDSKIKLLGEEDILGKSLLNMRNSLRRAKKEEEKRKEEEERRRWVNEGLAKFTDVLRRSNDNLATLSYEIIKHLAKYLDVNQGAVYIIDTDKDEKYLELTAAYALDEKRFFEKRIEIGKGYVGNCAIEKEKIFLTLIPEDYTEIMSGLGEAYPSCILLVPLKKEEEVLGVLELSSFKEIEDYKVEFVEIIAKNISSSIELVRVNTQTSELLEQSKQQSEELAAQEEEMRQNMEELQATQEESARKKTEMEALIHVLDSSTFIVEYDLDKKLTHINDAYLAIHEMRREDVIGLYHHDNMEFTDQQWKEYEQFWEDLKAGEVKKQQSVFKMKDKKYYLIEVFTPIKDENEKIFKVLKIAKDISTYS